jgi:phospholipid-binding lipoprotein MlaA
VLDERAELLDADALLSGDRYIFLRDAYLQRRSARIESETKEPEDVFSEFDDDWLDEDFEDNPL